MAKLNGKVALITGAARGIGAETACALIRQGSKLILTDRDAEPLSALAAEIGEERVVARVCDVCDLASMEETVAAGVERFGGIDLVLANAGIASYGSVMAVDPVMFKRVLDVNVLGVFHTVRAALPSLIERKGYILVVSSLAAFAPAPGLAAYNASKAGVEHFANALRLEVAYLGVDVGTAHMSWIDTPLVRDAKADLSAFRQMLDVLPGPLGKTTSVEACVSAFVNGLERRKRRIYVPGWVGAIAAARSLVTSRAGDRAPLKHVSTLLPRRWTPRSLRSAALPARETSRSTAPRLASRRDDHTRCMLTSPSPAPLATAADPVHSRPTGWFAIKQGFGNLKLPIPEVQMPNRRVALPSGPRPA